MECEIVDNTACGRPFKYCRTHRVEPHDCPKNHTGILHNSTAVNVASAYLSHSYTISFGRFLCGTCGYVPALSPTDPGCKLTARTPGGQSGGAPAAGGTTPASTVATQDTGQLDPTGLDARLPTIPPDIFLRQISQPHSLSYDEISELNLVKQRLQRQFEILKKPKVLVYPED